MKKFVSNKHSKLQKNLPFSYFSTNLYLDFSAYVFDRNGEHLVVWQDILYPNEFPCIFMPKKKENWTRCSVALATKEDIETIEKENIEILVNKPVGNEFFYSTENFINPKGSFKNRVKQFVSNYEYLLIYNCDKKRIIEFYNFWKSQRKHENITFEESEAFFNFCLNNLDKYDIKQVYVEVKNKIVGLAWGINFLGSNNWIGLHLKVNYQHKGLSRFLHHERAKIFEKYKEFSLCTEVYDKGIDKYKEELGPIYKKAYYYLLTGEKKD